MEVSDIQSIYSECGEAVAGDKNSNRTDHDSTTSGEGWESPDG